MGLWAAAANAADRTPDARNRYVDFLRAVSILAVISGHWLIAAPFVRDGRPDMGHMLGIQPWTQWLTFLFQVMPVFFMVGGYSNAASWEATRRDGTGYAAWLHARLRRLFGPVMPLILLWVVISIVARQSGASVALLKFASQAALVPTWFLAVYVLVALFVPITRAAWRRYGMVSFWALAVMAVLVDLVRFRFGAVGFAWVNYLFVWAAVHQLGYLWRDGRLAGPRRSLPWALLGAVSLFVLLGGLGYPRSMVGVPGETVSNTLPPSLAMLALGLVQAGLLLAFEAPARRWLSRRGPWTATVLINGMIMTVYLWHLTAMILLVGLLVKLGGFGLRLEPGSATWWALRPVWMVVLAVALVPFALVFGRFERPAPARSTPSALFLVVSAALVCAGLALLAKDGMVLEGWKVASAAVVFLGGALVGAVPVPFRRG